MRLFGSEFCVSVCVLCHVNDIKGEKIAPIVGSQNQHTLTHTHIHDKHWTSLLNYDL